MIRLRNEGPIQPAPRLQGFAEEVSTEVQTWPQMISVTHWQLGNPTQVDGVEFHVEGGGELGHIHLNGELHLALSRPLRDRLVELNLAEPFRWHRDWVTAPIQSEKGVDQAGWLFRLGYDRLLSTPESDLLNRIQARAKNSAGVARTASVQGMADSLKS